MVRLVAEQQRQADGAGTALPVADLAASFEQVVAEVLVERTCRCAKDQGLKTLVLVGGVAANRRLRSLLEARCQSLGLDWRAAPSGLLHRQRRHGRRGGRTAAPGRRSERHRTGGGTPLALGEAQALYGQPNPF
jgi:N6-L-threonylcarbamoyladenine synthase